MGGAYAEPLIEASVAGCVGLLAFFAAVACQGARGVADGSIVGARLREVLPSLPASMLAAGLWFALGEHVEPAHASLPVAITVLALAAAAFVIRFLAEASIQLLVAAVFAVYRSPFAPRAPIWSRRAHAPILVRRAPRTRRRFARPPPIADIDAAR